MCNVLKLKKQKMMDKKSPVFQFEKNGVEKQQKRNDVECQGARMIIIKNHKNHNELSTFEDWPVIRE